MGAPKKKYKRSWRNLLLDRSYQLKFTLFMVGLCAVLMSLLGWWVMKVAQKATTVSRQNIPVCAEPPTANAAPMMRMPVAPATDDTKPEPSPPDEAKAPADDADNKAGDADDKAGDADDKAGAADNKAGAADDKAGAAADKAAGTDDKAGGADDKAGDADKNAGDTDEEAPSADDAVPDRPRVKVTLDDTPDAPVVPMQVLPTDYVTRTVEFYTCRLNAAATARELADGQRLILIVLIIVGIMLVLGIAVYGIKMTHKVAGPLFKVQLYLAKMKKGRYDTVWNLRKGDQLVDFYAHFKDAHAGMRKMEEEDVARLKAMIAAAEKADLASKSPEIAAALDDMRATLARKEEGLE